LLTEVMFRPEVADAVSGSVPEPGVIATGRSYARKSVTGLIRSGGGALPSYPVVGYEPPV